MKTVVMDFDGVIHSYISGWKGVTVIPDPPVAGIKKAIEDIRDHGYRVIVVSVRCGSIEGMEAIREWLKKYDILVDKVTDIKPPADVYIDDRAIRFDGHPEVLLEEVLNFQPYFKRNNF